MSAPAQALPLALSAAVYPPALLLLVLLLTGKHPRRLVLAYFAGAAILTIGAGLLALALLNTAGLTTQDSSTASGWVYILVGLLLLLVLAVWAWRRKARDPGEAPEKTGAVGGRIAQSSRRATTSQKWAFILGLVMFLPSPLYLLAAKDIGAATRARATCWPSSSARSA